MKKNLTKLALSGAALAAVAATLGTSTYAWYTTNPTVSANNIVGASSDSGASSIYIAKDKVGNKEWSSQVTFLDTDFSAAKLIPVQPAAGKFTKLDGSDAAATDVLTFSLWFKSSKTADEVTYAAANPAITAETFTTDGSLYTRSGNEGAYVYTQVTSGEFSSQTYYKVTNGIDLYIQEITIANITDVDTETAGKQLPTADNLLYGNTTYSADDYGVSNGNPTYTVNFVKALGMRVVDTTSSAITKQTFALDQWETQASQDAYPGTVTTGKAHAYYNQVMTTDLTQQQITAGKALTADYAETAVTTLNPTGTNETARKLTFYVYLNGWNDFCYDACQGQQFALNMKFTKDADQALDAVDRV